MFGLTQMEWLGWGALAAGALAFAQAAVFQRGRSARAALILLWIWLGASDASPLRANAAWHDPLVAVLAPALLLWLSFVAETAVLSVGTLLLALCLLAEILVAVWLPPEVLAQAWQVGWGALPLFSLPVALPLDGALLAGGLAIAATLTAGLRWLRLSDPVLAGIALASASTAVLARSPDAESPDPVWLLAGGMALLCSVGWAGYRMAFLDPLTGLPGRRPLEERLARLGRNWAVAMVDVDHFKKFNDTYGHDVGDQVLRLVATRLRKHFGGSAYRYGGEEFTVVFAGHEAGLAAARCDAFRADLETRVLTLRGRSRPRKKPAGARRGGGRSGAAPRGKASAQAGVGVTVSVGVAHRMPEHGKPAAVVKAADAALYQAKRKGRNRVVDAAAPGGTRT
ncbi:MAG: GGDEF domain-containing protein [Pseudomonadales bacterium]|nr:GGDEF domain-containing protein [Pseudomonadales bacterium]